MMPAWRAVPASLAAGLEAMQKSLDMTAKVAENATKAASGTPGQPAALAAEAAAKAAAVAAFSGAISGAQAASAGLTATSGNGTPDMHNCMQPRLTAPGCFHGPGVVLKGSNTVMINGLPATRQGDAVVEALGGPDKIVMGEMTVDIG
jgi:uncharacterized Zn-binding protein involved in type VI secretion